MGNLITNLTRSILFLEIPEVLAIANLYQLPVLLMYALLHFFLVFDHLVLQLRQESSEDPDSTESSIGRVVDADREGWYASLQTRLDKIHAFIQGVSGWLSYGHLYNRQQRILPVEMGCGDRDPNYRQGRL